MVLGTSEFFAEGTRIPFLAGPLLQRHGSCSTARTSSSWRTDRIERLFGESGIDPIGKTVRIGSERFEVVGAFGKRPTPGGFSGSADDFVVIPHTTYPADLRRARRAHRQPGDDLEHPDLRRAARRHQRPGRDGRDPAHHAIRHGLKLDQPDDFDLFTQDSILKLYERVSQATLFALVVISSIALMVGGIGVMAIMSISVTERTREIGVRKALGARRVEILFQFLMEASFLTSLGGVLGIALGSGIGLAGPPRVGLPRVAPVVVLRHRPRLLRLGRHLFRHVSRLQSLPPRPDRSPSLRIAADLAASGASI